MNALNPTLMSQRFNSRIGGYTPVIRARYQSKKQKWNFFKEVRGNLYVSFNSQHWEILSDRPHCEALVELIKKITGWELELIEDEEF